MAHDPGSAYVFAEFVFHPARGLTRAGDRVDIEPRAQDLLHYLLRHRDRIVTRDELQQQLWDGRIVTDAAISTQIRTVRRALGDDRLRQGFIRTYPKRGFRFVAAVEETATPGPGPRRILHRRLLSGLAAAALAIAGVLVIWPGTGRAPGPSEPLSIVVLPFADLSAEGTAGYLADAFTEDLVTDLSRIRDAFVISRSTTFTYRGRGAEPVAVARDLGVRYVLDGSLRIDGQTVRVNAQLLDGDTGRHVWSDRLDLPRADLFDAQENVTGRIASVLRAELRMAESRRQEPRPGETAWDHALRGNVILYNHETIADYQQAYDHLMQAVTLDPTISSAWGGLAFVHFVASLSPIPEVSRPDSARLALNSALKAVEADPMNAEPYWLVGAGYARIGEPERGMPACRTAIELNPNMDCAHVCAGLVHLANGEPAKAVPYFRHALKLNPRFRPFTKEKYLGLAHIQSGNETEAIAALNRALLRAPQDTFANLALAAALALDGRPEAGRTVLEGFETATGRPAPTIAALRQSVGWMGPDVDRMLGALRELGVSES